MASCVWFIHIESKNYYSINQIVQQFSKKNDTLIAIENVNFEMQSQ